MLIRITFRTTRRRGAYYLPPRPFLHVTMYLFTLRRSRLIQLCDGSEFVNCRP